MNYLTIGVLIFCFSETLQSQGYEVFPLHLHDTISYVSGMHRSNGGGYNGTVTYYVNDSTVMNDTTVHWTVVERSINIFDYQPERVRTLTLIETTVGMHKLQCAGVVWEFPSQLYKGDYPKIYRYSDSSHVIAIGVTDGYNRDTVWCSAGNGIYRRHTWASRQTYSPPYMYYTYDIYSNRINLVTAIDTIESALPLSEYSLHQNYPNPFNAQTTISFDLPSSSDVNLTIYDILGREVIILADQSYRRGHHSITWDAHIVNSGIYIARLAMKDRVEMIKLILMK